MSNKNQIKPLAQFESNLDSLLAKAVDSIPNDINSDMLKMNALMKISQDPKLMAEAQKQPGVISQFVFNFVVQGLNMLSNECYIVPYGGKLTAVIDYRGEKKIAMQYSVKPIKIILSGVVHESDSYGFNKVDGSFFHEFDPFSTKRGDIVGGFCSVIYTDGTRHEAFVNKDEIDKVKGVSPSSSSNYSPWVKWYSSMVEKTAIKKAMKYINLDFGSNIIQQAYNESSEDVDFNNERRTKQEKVEQSDVFDATYEEIDEKTGEVTEVVIDIE